MEPVSGFMSCDGKFFSSSDACRSYEERIAHLSGLSERVIAVVESCSSGTFYSLPQDLRRYLQSIPSDQLEDMWKESLKHLFVDEMTVLNRKSSALLYEVTESEVWEFFQLHLETTYRLLAFVLEKPL
jgi:hypothetical protein